MSTTYFITPIDPLEWEQNGWSEAKINLKVDAQHLATQLKAQWPNAEVYTYPSGLDEIVTWTLPSNITGSLQSDRHTIAFKFSHQFAEFVLWYRAFISNEHPLYLSDDSSEATMEIKANTTESEIVQFLKRR